MPAHLLAWLLLPLGAALAAITELCPLSRLVLSGWCG